MPLPVSMDITWLDGSVSFNAQELRRADAALYTGEGSTPLGVWGGIVRHSDASLAVSVSVSDVVTIQPGAVVIAGNSGVGNGVYRGALGAAETGNLAARNATNPRIDLVVFRALDTSVVGAHAAYTGRIEIIAGTPAVSPVAPALPLLAVELARIAVPIAGGAAATVDSSFRPYAAAIGGILPVATAARLPATPNAKFLQAVTIDTGICYTWDGTGWRPASGIQHTADGTRLDATGTSAPSHPVGLRMIAGRQSINFTGGVGTLTFSGGGFANGVHALTMTTLSGSADNPVVSAGAVTKTAATIVIPGLAGVGVVSYIAIGW